MKTDEELLMEIPARLIEAYGRETLLKLMTSRQVGEHGGIKFYATTRCEPAEMFMLYGNGELVHVKNMGLLQ
jgi:hypothetical protein